MKCLKITCPSAVTDKSLRKLENYYGIEFERGASNGGGENGYVRMIGDEDLLNNLSFHNLIKIGLVKDAKQTAVLNQTNWNKNSAGASVSLAGSDGSDVMQVFPEIYAILGGKNPAYERYIISNEEFSYDGEDAVKIDMHAESPDFITFVDGLSRSIYSEDVAGSMGTTKLTGMDVDAYQNAAGYPKASTSRYGFESAARKRNADSTTNLPYCNATTLDLELIMALLYIECRTKNLNSVFGHGISSNVTPSAANWGTVSGVRITDAGGTVKYLALGSSSVYVGGKSTSILSLINGQYSLLKIFEAQRGISNGDTLDTVYNSDGTPLQGKSAGVMTGVWTRTINAKLTCSLTSTGTDAACDVQIVLKQPVWRGRTRLWGNIWGHYSGQEVVNYADADGTTHNILFRAPSIAAIATDTDEANKTSLNGYAFTSVYEQLADLGGTSGWCKESIVTKDGITVPTGKGTGAAVNNYESAYTSLAEGTAGVYKRKQAGLFGGDALNGYVVLRDCYARNAPSYPPALLGSGLRAHVTA